MSDNVKWWFAPANHGESKGENTGDKEIFKKDTYVSLAREILQNSIDARHSDEEPVKIEFKEFEIDKNIIPGLDEYTAQIKRCISYWKRNPENQAKYKDILKYLETNDKINCLRISDQNTTGLTGIKCIESTVDNPYNALVKGTGVSSKSSDYAGGSKGVGKNVPFLLSKLMMVFYETHTIDEEYGSVGVTKLSSGFVDDNEDDPQRDYTQGTGYYACSNLLLPLEKYIIFDKNYKEREKFYGTDIYVIGFESIADWYKDVISSICESFMAAIIKNDLIINFNDIEINSESINDLINSDYIHTKNKKGILAQYQILKNEDDKVQLYDIETDLGNAKMYILTYSKEEENNATKKCFMIRSPMMFIRSYDLAFNVSAMIIIEQNALGKALRSVENDAHNDWEIKRMKNLALRKEIEAAITSIREQINQNVLDCLKLGDDSPLDPNGAGEYLADEDIGEDKVKESKSLDAKDNAEAGGVRSLGYREKNPSIEDENGSGDEPNIGDTVDDETGEEQIPGEENSGSGGEPHEGDQPARLKDGEREVIVKVCMSGIKYKVISTNKKEGELKIIFISPESHDKCYLNLALLDDVNSRTPLEILNLKANGKLVEYEDSFEPGAFAVQMNEKTVLEVKVNKDDYFACEVKVKYESRQ